MSQYQYQELESGRIRLLKFCSSQDGKLEFSMDTQRLESCFSSYIALSYRWIQSGETCYIKINGSCFAISQNLRDALVQIKARFASEWSALSIWVDAICINQSDAEEKNAQVSMMGEIYSQAARVAAWLGNPSDDRIMRLAFEHLAFIDSFALPAETKSARLRASQKSRDERVRPAIDREVYKRRDQLIGPEGTDAHIAWQGIKETWQNSWWQRVWIVQECTVKEGAARQILGNAYNKDAAKVFFLCGRYTTTWRPIGYSTVVLATLARTPSLPGTADLLKDDPRDIVHATWLIKFDRKYDRSNSLLEQLQLTRLRDSTDPRDKVYANRALMAESTQQLICPNYSRSVIDTYLDVVRAELHQARSLDFLGYAIKLTDFPQAFSAATRSGKWPSWIPNWDDPLNIQPFPKKLHGYTRDIRGRPWLRQVTFHGGWRGPDHDWYQNKLIENGIAYNASRNQTMEATISGYELHVKGAKLDVVKELYTFNDKSEDSRNRLDGWRFQLHSGESTFQNLNSALFTAQVANVKMDGRRRAITKGYSIDNRLLKSGDENLTPAQRAERNEMSATMNITRKDRGLCLTACGYVGLVPESTEPGDCICILFGGQVLYVLRPKAGAARQYEYIGECYMHGLMDGEGMSWIQSGKVSVEEFRLV